MTVGGWRWQRSAGDRQKQLRQFSATLGGSAGVGVGSVFSACAAGRWGGVFCFAIELFIVLGWV